jgi:Bacterial Ig domain
MPRARIQRLGCVALAVAPLLCFVWLSSGAREALAESPPPAVMIIGPVQGETVEGTIAIRARVTPAPEQEITSVEFFDGANRIGSADCQGQGACEALINWNATGLSGAHSLTAEATQGFETSSISAPVMVTVLSPPPTVSITAPTIGATVKGDVSVAVSGATDPSQVDYPTSIVVFDGVNRIGTIECQGQRTCQGSVTWHATGLTGLHALTAQLNTHEQLTVSGAPVSVQVVSPPPTVRITSPSPYARLGGSIVVRVSGATDPSLVDYPTSIAVFDGTTDEIGSIDCQGQQTCSGSVRWNTKGLSGLHTLLAVIHTNTGVSATSPHVPVGGARPQGKPKPKASASCHLHELQVPVRRKDRGVCVLPGVPKGTPVAIQYRRGSSGWSTVVRGHVGSGGHYGFVLRGVRKATYALTILVSANRTYATTRAEVGTLRID